MMPSSINISNVDVSVGINSDYFLDDSSEDEDKYDLDEEYSKLRESIENLCEEHRHELYDQSDKKYYNYDGLLTLTTTPLEEINPFQIKEVHVCPYSVNTAGMYPFLEYILVKNKIIGDEEEDEIIEEKELNFLHFPFFFGLNIMKTSTQVLQIILKRMNDFDYKGYLLENGNLYVFFDTSVEKQERAVYKDDYTNVHHCLMDEIINNSFIQQIPICGSTREFFLDHLDLVFLKDINDTKIEIPTVVYTGTTSKKMEFISVFGHSHSDADAVLGSHYYFTSYKNAVKQSEEALTEYKNRGNDATNNRDVRGALVRFAVFLGKINVPSRLPCTSDEKAEWMKDFDSVYLGKISKINEPIWVLNKYEQQTPLSYHKV
jgi:hypothetical protein